MLTDEHSERATLGKARGAIINIMVLSCLQFALSTVFIREHSVSTCTPDIAKEMPDRRTGSERIAVTYEC
jgi:hypothetical protein